MISSTAGKTLMTFQHDAPNSHVAGSLAFLVSARSTKAIVNLQRM